MTEAPQLRVEVDDRYLGGDGRALVAVRVYAPNDDEKDEECLFLNFADDGNGEWCLDSEDVLDSLGIEPEEQAGLVAYVLAKVLAIYPKP